MTPQYFKSAYWATMDHEGLGIRTNDPVDPGGDTFSGISRVYWPRWIGWPLLEASGGKVTPELMAAVEEFYLVNFWNQIRGDELAALSPQIAEEVFDTAVNMSCQTGVRFLQEALSLLNNNGRIYPDLMLDGVMGWKTLESVRLYCASRPPAKEVAIARLLRVMNTLQGYHYIEQMRKHPEKEKFRGWFDRI